MIKIACSCGNEATRVKKDGELPKFNVSLIERNGVVVGVGYKCLACDAKTDFIK